MRNQVLNVRISLFSQGAMWGLYSCLFWGKSIFFSLVARLSMKQVRILQLDEDVLCVRYSPNQKLLAVSLLDCTVKVFYTDTLKVCDCMDCEALIIIAWKMRSMLENCTFIVGFQ